MDNKTFQQIKDIILKHQEVAVIVGANPTLDKMAAGLGLYLVLTQMGKNAVIATPSQLTVANSSLVGIDKVQNSLGTGGVSGDLTVSFPYKEGEIDKVSYTLDNGMLNIVVKAGENGLSFQQSDVQFKRGGKLPTLVMLVGVPHLADVASLFTPQAGVEVVNIDNSVDNEKYGDLAVVDTRWSSVSEQVADFVTLLEPQIELDADTAQNLLDGIDFATQDFTSPKTSYLAFEVAGILMKKGATRDRAKQISQNSQGANTLPNSNAFFPPIPGTTQVNTQAPVQPKPVQPVMPQPTTQTWQSFNPVQQQPVAPVQPVSMPSPLIPQAQPQPAPVANPAPVTAPVNVPQQPGGLKQAPPDWLTPKVYKGSTIL